MFGTRSTMSTMLEQLALIFVAAALLMIPAIALIFTIRPHRATRRMPSSSQGRLRRLAMAAGGIGLAAMCIGLLIGRGFADSAVAALVVAGAVLVWLPLGRVWAGRGVVAWALTVAAGSAFLAFSLLWTVTTDLDSAGVLAGMFLWLLEAIIVGIGLANIWELVDARARRVEPSVGSATGRSATEPRERRRAALAGWVSPARHGSMLIVAGVVGAVVYLAPFTTQPDIGDLGDHADGRGSSPDATTTEPDSPPRDQLPPVKYDDNPRPTQTTATQHTETPATEAPPTARDARPTTAQPTTVQPTTPDHVAPGRPTEKPPPPGQIKEPPGQSKHSDQSDQDQQ